jgi:hypothetical protein
MVSLDLSGVEAVDGYPNAIDAAAGTTVDIAVPRETADALALGVGHEIELQARSTPRGLFAHPHRVARR